MKKSFITTIFLSMAAILLISGCASTSSSSGGIKASARSLKNVKQAEKVAASWQLPSLDLYKLDYIEYDQENSFAAYNPETNECVIYIEIDSNNPAFNKILFTYCNLNGKASSLVMYDVENIGEFRLENSDSNADLVSGNYYLSTFAIEGQTRDMVSLRSRVKVDFIKTLKVEFLDVIHKDQIALTGSNL